MKKIISISDERWKSFLHFLNFKKDKKSKRC
jgi:hypothetical protein